MISAWNYEAANLAMSELDGDFIDDIIFRNNKVNEFLNIERDRRFFIVAPKGFGKTLLLKIKSQSYRNKIKGAVFIPKNQLCERLFDVIPTYGSEYTKIFSKKETWEKIWKLSLLILLIKHSDEYYELPEELNRIITDAKSLNGILGSLLSQRKQIFKLIELIPKILLNKIEQINKPAYIFIDNIDEAFVRFIKEYRTFEEDSRSIWINTQVGLMTAVRDICDNNSHIKIYAAIQSEAVLRPKDSLFLQLRDYSTELNYHQKELKEIFDKNIQRMDVLELKSPKSQNAVEKFIGCTKFKHRFAKNQDGTSREEDVFDFIYRHTLGRTREIVMMGAEINHIPIEERTIENIIEIVNERSNTILLQYQSEIMGPSEINAYETFCQRVNCNVISRAGLEAIKKEVFEVCGYENIDNYLFRIGLLGWTEDQFESDFMIQRFLPAARNVYDESKILPYSNFYLIHSCMDKDLLKYHGKLFYDQGNIIGNGYGFFPKKKKQDSIEEYTSLIQKGDFAFSKGELADAISYFQNTLEVLINSESKEHVLTAEVSSKIGVSYKLLFEETINSRKKQEYKNNAIEKLNLSGDMFVNISRQENDINDRIMYSKKAIIPFSNTLELDERNLTALEGMLTCAEIEGNSSQMLGFIMRVEKARSEIQYEINLKTKISITNIQIKDVSIFSTIDWNVQRNINILLGKNGYGKTHLLRLIVSLLQQNIDTLHRDFLRKGNSQTVASIRVLQENLPLSVTLTTVFSDILRENYTTPDHNKRNKKLNVDDIYIKNNPGVFPVLAIPDNRYIDKSKVEINRPLEAKKHEQDDIDFLVHSGAVSFINQTSINRYVEDFLYKIGMECLLAKGKDNGKSIEILIREIPIVRMVEDVFKLLTDKGFIFFDVEPLDSNFTSFKILVKTEGNPEPIPIQKASQGTLSIIGVLGLIYNYLESLNKIGKLRNEDIMKVSAIVVIEEIDAHLHPSWQQRIISILRNIFPNVQFIMSSHSPLIVAGCYENEVCIIKKDEDFFCIEQIDHDFLGWTTNELYNEEIFNIDEYDDNYLYYCALSNQAEKFKIEIDEYYKNEVPNLLNDELLIKEKQLHYINKCLRKQEEKNYLSQLIIENVNLKNEINKTK